MPQPKVSIITVHYNQPDITAALLHSLRGITYANTEIWVVDNASPVAGTETLEPLFPEVNFLKSTRNLGFAGGNNLAVTQATGEYLLFINNDTEVEAGFLEPLVACMQKDASIGMASSKLKYYYEDNVIQYAGMGELSTFTARNKTIGMGEKDLGQFDQSGPTAYIHGASMLVSRAVLEKTGPMDEQFFLYYEELDWCARAKRDGFKIWYVAESVVYHKESVSTGKDSPFRVFYLTRNRLFFVRRNFRWYQQFFTYLHFVFLAIPKNSLVYLLQGRKDYLKAFWQGIVWNLKN